MIEISYGAVTLELVMRFAATVITIYLFSLQEKQKRISFTRIALINGSGFALHIQGPQGTATSIDFSIWHLSGHSLTKLEIQLT